ncbi:MAG: PKD domain-containing protein [Pedosphaera sp.]|nr:PKD domain-containing protein [Pedosphaera sp.]
MFSPAPKAATFPWPHRRTPRRFATHILLSEFLVLITINKSNIMKTSLPTSTVGLLLLSALTSFSQPVITTQPDSQSVSLGATVEFKVAATGTSPLTYAWRFNDQMIDGATTSRLTITNVQPSHAGAYKVVVSNTDGNATSNRAELDIDPTFRKITSGPLVDATGEKLAAAWADYDNDGWIDVVIPRGWSTGRESTLLFHNDHDGHFTQVTEGVLARGTDPAEWCAWADYNNDGNLDLFVGCNESLSAPSIYLNQGQGVFTKFKPEPPWISNGVSVRGWALAWGDFDNDGFVDVAVAYDVSTGKNTSTPDSLLHNNGDGTFAVVANSAFARKRTYEEVIHAVDYDNDGNLDLFAPGVIDINLADNHTNALFRNLGNGNFESVASGTLSSDEFSGLASSWVDFDNDGDLDLFQPVTAFTAGGSRLYRNDGGVLTLIDLPPITGLVTYGATWADYDNDGYLDLFAPGVSGNVAQGQFNGPNRLFHNERNGTFSEITRGSLTSDTPPNTGWGIGEWADYDNDGFLDLLVVNWNAKNHLYHNNGNTNRWLKIGLVGVASNRAAIGAKVRVKATIGGKTFWQMRVIQAQGHQQELIAHFGLGDATKVETLRIEWPSGIVQEMQNVNASQFLTVVESQGYRGAAPQLSGASNGPDGLQLSMTEPAAGASYVLEASSDLVTWTKLMARKSAAGTTQFIVTRAAGSDARFYRLQVP